MTKIMDEIQKASRSRPALKTWLQKLLSGLPTSELALVNLWGSHGSGKTTFLYKLGFLLQELPGTFVFGPQDATQYSYAELAAQIMHAIDAAPAAFNKVVLIDNLESIAMEDGSDRTDFMEFESDLIMKLIQRSDILFIIASLHELRQWHYFEIKMRQASILLPPVGHEEISVIAAEIHLSSQKVYEMTYGYPPALTWIKHNPGADNPEIDQFIAQSLLNGLPQNVQEAAFVTSLLLDFDVAVFQLATNAAGLNLGRTYHDCVSVIQKLGIAGFIVHDIRNGGYRFADHSTRRLLSRIYRSNQPEAFEKIHRKMMAFYQNEARRASFLPQFLVNAIYHMAWANERQGKRATSRRCQEWIREAIPLWTNEDWQEVYLAWKSGRKSLGVVEEITHLTGKNAYQQISKQIKLAGRS